jgi:hypothetical protein
MGVDSVIYVRGKVTEEMRAELLARSLRIYGEENGLDLRPCFESDDYWQAHMMDRLYSPGYARGTWPTIYGKIRLVQHVCQGLTVEYGGDNCDSGEPCTLEFLEERWTLWVRSDKQTYHSLFAR